MFSVSSKKSNPSIKRDTKTILRVFRVNPAFLQRIDKKYQVKVKHTSDTIYFFTILYK